MNNPDPKENSWQFCIDTGGTFTDCLGRGPDGTIHRCKVLSSGALRGRIIGTGKDGGLTIEQEWNAPDGFVNGFRFRLGRHRDNHAIVEHFDARQSILYLSRHPAPIDEMLNASFEVLSGEEAPLLAVKLITQTCPGQTLPAVRMKLATTRGTNALLERKGSPTLLLITKGFGDLLRIGNQQRPDLFSLKIDKPEPLHSIVLEVPERIDRSGNIVHPLDLKSFESDLNQALDQAESVAICLMNSYQNPLHEEALAGLLEGRNCHVSVSSRLSRTIRIVTRARTTEVNAYLAPVMKSYIDNVCNGLEDPDLRIMTSTGSLTLASLYEPKDGLLSGPAGGIAGAAAVGRSCGIHRLISFDMGGTSTDVSRYDHGFDYSREHRVGDASLATPALTIETVASGGGSVCGFDGESLTVGPGSAGADPGPACYGSGGPLTITDVNLLTGRLDQANFHMPVDLDAAKAAFHKVFMHIKEVKGESVSGHEVLEGFLDIANEKMAQAITSVSTAKGFDPADYTLVAFGGAGGQHATAVASKLGITRILLPPDAGLFSAYGLSRARIEKIETLQCLETFGDVVERLPSLFEDLSQKAEKELEAEGVPSARTVRVSRTVFVRLRGQESTLEVPWSPGADLAESFRNAYQAAFGHWIEGREVEVESLRMILAEQPVPDEPSVRAENTDKAPLMKLRSMEYRGSRTEIPVYRREDLAPGMIFSSPALVLDPFSTLFAEPGWTVQVRSDQSLELLKDSSEDEKSIPEEADRPRDEVVNLQLYMNRFAAVAEQMGEKLRRTALSVNVRERFDFSCALLDRDGYLVANAPHIPVHLGAMGLCVRTLMKSIEMLEGDVVMTNHPAYGGSHLPDITLVSPIFYRGERVGFVANRAHHSEIGGKTPGSMPPDASSLAEEGVVFPPCYLLRRGEDRWEQIKRRLGEGPWPSRSVDENMADLQAGAAANHHGARNMLEMLDRYGAEEVTHYMGQLRSYAASRMRSRLKKMENGLFRAEESMDDGSMLKVECRVEGSRLTMDFNGTSGTHPGNLNANPAIVNSVLVYVLRLLIDEPLPLNDGLLDPVELILPESMLNPPFSEDPADCPAVVGGNIETSQRLTDTILKAFGISACSQGTMNNVLFGNPHFGYYETVAGGTGAGDGFHGADAVHHHMTNTRATDPEVLEYRYPARLERFSIRQNSGGRGRWNGGNGVQREITFLEPVSLSVLTQHRIIPPYGLKGGQPGQTGSQWIIRSDGSRRELKWRDHAEMKPGDRFILRTPGGGGFETPS